jgi:N-acetylneuraminic acid mutarotase
MSRNPRSLFAVAKKSVLGFVILLLLTSATTIRPIYGTSVSANTWVSKAPMHVARAGLGVAAVDGKVYAIGGATQTEQSMPFMGFGGSGFVGTNEQYDPSTDSWVFKASMPTPRAKIAIAVFQNKIYCIGGITDNAPTGVNEVYDPATDTWTTKTPMPTPTYGQANVACNKIYVLSGNSYGTGNQVYDPATDSWSDAPSWSYASFRWASTAFNGSIYVLSGVDPLAGGVYYNQIFNAIANTWSQGSSPLYHIFGGAAEATTGVLAPERVYLMGMKPSLSSGAPLSPIQVYDVATDKWSIGASMPTARTDFGVANINDTFYAVGGYTYTLTQSGDPIEPVTPTAVNEQYTPIGYGTPDPSYLLEHTPPEISVLSPVNQTYNESSISLVFTVNKSVNWIGYSLDGNQNVTITGNETIANVTDGLHSITVYANDTFGNMGVYENATFTVALPESDSPQPLVTIAIAISGATTLIVVVAGVFYIKKRKRQSFG